MGKIKSCCISTKGKEVYRPGETISGTFTIDVEDGIKIKGLKIFCMGQALTKWSSKSGRWSDDAIGSETYVNHVVHLLSGDGPHELSAGKHSYSFSFRLPSQGLPSSFEGNFGAIRYWLNGEVVKLFPNVNSNFYKCFTVLAHLNMNEQAYQPPAKGETKKTLSKALGFGDAGTLFLNASINRTGYCPGEQIAVTLKARNESTKNLGYVQASLVQNVSYSAGSESDSTVKKIRTVQDKKLEKGETREWKNQKLLIDPVPPSSKMLTSHIIKVTYHVLFEIEVPLGINLELKLPIKIGTCPIGINIPSQPRLTSPGQYVVDLSDKVTYKRCTYGVEKPGVSNNSFVNINYSPMTAFVSSSSTSGASASPSVTTAPVSPKALSTTSPKGGSNPSTAAAKKAQAAAAPTVVPSTQVTRPTASNQPPAYRRQVPSAPPLLPPSYEEACSVDGMSTVPKPFFMQPEAGKGSILCFLFPPTETEYIQDCFKRNIPNLMLHSGKILAFNPEMTFIPSLQTSAIFIQFGSERTSLSWLQNMISFDPSLTSKCWVAIAENKVNLGPLAETRQGGVFSMVVFKRNSGFKLTKVFSDEYAKLLKNSLRPIKQKHGGKAILSGKVIFACGNWSTLGAKASELTFAMNQWPSLENCLAYKKELTTDPGLIRFMELLHLFCTRIVSVQFPVGDISMFEN